MRTETSFTLEHLLVLVGVSIGRIWDNFAGRPLPLVFGAMAALETDIANQISYHNSSAPLGMLSAFELRA